MKRTAAILSAVAILSFSMAAQAVLRDKDFEQARKDAMHHLQVKVTKLGVPSVTPADCRLWVDVVRVFKGRTRFLSKGLPLEFDVSCKRDNDLIPTGDTLWLEIDDLGKAAYLEIYLNSHKDGNRRVFDVPNWQSVIVDKPTRNPTCPDTEPGKSCQ